MTTHVPGLAQELGKMYAPIVVHKPILREGILENIYLCWRLLFNARYMTKINPPRVDI